MIAQCKHAHSLYSFVSIEPPAMNIQFTVMSLCEFIFIVQAPAVFNSFDLFRFILAGFSQVSTVG